AFIGADFYLKIADVPHEINGVKITEIRENTFAGVLSLEKIILPQTIVSIGNQAVSNCKNLKEMYVPASVTTISKTAFEGTGNFIMYVEEGSYAETFAKSNNIEYKHYIPKPLKPIPTEDLKAVFGGQYKEFIYDMIYYNNVPMCAITFSNWQGNKTKDVVVPAQFNGADVTVLMTRAIDFGDNIETITLPDTVIAIDDEAFSACSNLKKVYFTENVTFIGKSVFKSYPNVTICAPKDSYAHRYAIENKINFEETPNTN
ncbi:MAG: leucine-rich repeat domain-containing protein, partial [Oscillospiraceae bacterium]|nr:leucine-rich repeat domain-containing protein [Oscillospiraceae bacterium]